MKASVIIANRNDIEMLAVTIRSAIEELSPLRGGGEVVIVDNSDEEYREAISSICPKRYKDEGKLQLHWQNFPCLFTARERAAEEARGDYIICLDSHMICGHNSIKNLVDFMNSMRRREVGFAHGPLNWVAQHEDLSRHEMKNPWGAWGRQYHYRRLVSWKGMPWICRRKWFLDTLNGYGALSQHKQSWGGGDMYLGTKSWMFGFPNYAVPSRPFIHLGPFPMAVRRHHKYRRYANSGQNPLYSGFLIALYALGAEGLLNDPEYREFLTTQFKVDIRGNKDLAWELAQDDRAWINEHKRYSFEELTKLQPWGKHYHNALDFLRPTLGRRMQRGIKPDDWYALEEIIHQFGVKSVLEFGAGISTYLFEAHGLHTISYETNERYAKLLTKAGLRTKFFIWDNKSDLYFDGVFDLALVDGANDRKKQIQIAKQHAQVIVVHDAETYKRLIESELTDWKEIPFRSKNARAFCKA